MLPMRHLGESDQMSTSSKNKARYSPINFLSFGPSYMSSNDHAFRNGLFGSLISSRPSLTNSSQSNKTATGVTNREYGSPVASR